jgi:hypothetical protein
MARVPANPTSGGAVARAKRTDRAEARRRYRAQLAEQTREPAEESDATEGDAASGRPASTTPDRKSQTTAPPPQPSGIAYAFRAAFHQPKYREDIAYLPRLIIHWSVWAPVLVMVATAGVFLATGGREIVSSFAIPYFVAPPPIGSIFIAGFFAPRASYLAGGIVGLISAVVLAVMVAAAPPSALSPEPEASASPSPSASAAASPGTSGSPAASPVASGSPPASVTPSASAAPSVAGSPAPSQAPGGNVIPSRMTVDQALGYALATSPLSGVFFGAAAAWYRRFLRLANPNRARPTSRQAPRRRR